MSAGGDRIEWTLSGATAVLPGIDRRPAMRFDLDHPEAGLAGCPSGLPPGEPEDGDRLLGIDLHGAARLVDHWARGHDLTAIYEAAPDRHLRATAMWRPLGGELAAVEPFRCWEVIVSAQTPLLHEDAALAVVCDLEAEAIASGTLAGTANGHGDRPARAVEWSAFAAGLRAPQAVAVLARRPARYRGPASSVVVVLHAGDAAGLTASITTSRARVVCPLFGMPLEKGVLLRSRVLAAIGPAALDTEWAERLVRGYRALPPMLDT